MKILDTLPGDSAVIILSGGLDSTIAMRLCVEKYGRENVKALTFLYGQKQSYEIQKAIESTTYLGVTHRILDLSILGEIAMGFSANVDPNIEMPTIKQVLGNPQPKTYVPNRNMILLSLAASFAETVNIPNIFTGLQATDLYNYWDTTGRFIGKMNDVLSENRTFKPHISAPFSGLTKKQELELLFELDGNDAYKLIEKTLTCYNPTIDHLSCGNCPSCSERIKAFIDIGRVDPIKYIPTARLPWRN